MHPESADQHKKLLKAIDEILFWKWDPLDINEIHIVGEDVFWPRDEYEMYVDDVFQLLMRPEVTTDELAKFLSTLASENMGVYPSAPEHDLLIAKMLMILRNASSSK